MEVPHAGDTWPSRFRDVSARAVAFLLQFPAVSPSPQPGRQSRNSSGHREMRSIPRYGLPLASIRSYLRKEAS